MLKRPKKPSDPNWEVEWWNDRFRGGYHKVSNLTEKEAKRLFTLVWRLKASRALLGNSRGTLVEKNR